MVRGISLTPEQMDWARRIEQVALDGGLSFFEVVFESLPACDVNAMAAYGGFAERYASWRFGMDFERLQKGYSHGFSKIYELVINGDPTQAYLVSSNSLMEQKLVMAHVFGHADFFMNNIWFAATERHMASRMADHAERLSIHSEQHGKETVERFMDQALALDSLLDPYLPQRRSWAGDQTQNSRHDLLGFLERRAPLRDWQRECLSVVRDEAYYFLPQRQTKIINEGWACYWHCRILTGGILDGSEIVDFAECHAGATASSGGRWNPYKLGLELFRHAERVGMDLFELRRMHNDLSFVDDLADAEFAKGSTYFQERAQSGQDWKAAKEELLLGLTWCGGPQIEITDLGVEVGEELVLHHKHDGRDLHEGEAGPLLEQLASLWGAPVSLRTQLDGADVIWEAKGKTGIPESA
ncbi:MAG: SpoVR family protein [Planctomycetota bacterium]|nr:SpoVR family protein [Planctomycetota bacterium]